MPPLHETLGGRAGHGRHVSRPSLFSSANRDRGLRGPSAPSCCPHSSAAQLRWPPFLCPSGRWRLGRIETLPTAAAGSSERHSLALGFLTCQAGSKRPRLPQALSGARSANCGLRLLLQSPLIYCHSLLLLRCNHRADRLRHRPLASHRDRVLTYLLQSAPCAGARLAGPRAQLPAGRRGQEPGAQGRSACAVYARTSLCAHTRVDVCERGGLSYLLGFPHGGSRLRVRFPGCGVWWSPRAPSVFRTL